MDIFPLLRDPVAFETLITHFLHRLTSHTTSQSPSKKIDVVVGLDARGFLLGPTIALRLGAAFIPVRKQGKLPGKCIQASYEKEYGVVRAPRFHAVSAEPHMLYERISSRCRQMRYSLVRMSLLSMI